MAKRYEGKVGKPAGKCRWCGGVVRHENWGEDRCEECNVVIKAPGVNKVIMRVGGKREEWGREVVIVEEIVKVIEREGFKMISVRDL